MSYISVSFTHKNTDISIREKLSFSNDERKIEILKLISSNKNIKECMVLSTCNRVEILAYSTDLKLAAEFIILAISKLSAVEFEELKTRVDIYENSGAIHHLFSVASSLDSLVIGETQIVGQLKDAYNFAKDNGFCANFLARAIQSALKCAAQVRNKTNISKNPISVASVAVTMAKDKLGSLKDQKVLVIGAGEMAELACKHLLNQDSEILILNRNLQHAKDLIIKIKQDDNFKNAKIDCDDLSNLEDFLNSYKLVFSATGANFAIINDDLIKDVDFKRYFFDIAVPRDIDISKNEKIDVFYVDDLKEIVKKNLALREEQAQIAYAVVGENTKEFFKMIKMLSTTPLIKALRQKAKDTSEIELKKAIDRGYLKHCDLEEARKLIHQVFKAFLHTPTINLKNLSEKEEMKFAIDNLQEIFDIKDKFEEFCKENETNKMEIKDEI